MKPFRIRHIHVSPSLGREESVDSSRAHGVFQISASDYDDIASNHPRARLTYMDEDDGDQITVGSSLELSQRLDEPLVDSTHGNILLESAHYSEDGSSPMHIFDIRRSNSVTGLWKRFENQTGDSFQIYENASDVHAVVEPEAGGILEQAKALSSDSSTATLDNEKDSQPLMAAFEAELAHLLQSSEKASETRSAQPEPSPAAASSANTNSQQSPHPAEVLATQILNHLLNGASMVQSELRSRLPEFQRQLRDLREAQTNLPENVGTRLQSLIATIEAQMKIAEAHLRNAFNNIPDDGRHLAEEAIGRGMPVAETAAESLRAMANNLNDVGRTLFEAFEYELGRAGFLNPSTAFNRSSTMPGAFHNVASNETTSSNLYPHVAEPRSMNPTFHENQSTGIQPPVTDPGASKDTTISAAGDISNNIGTTYKNLDPELGAHMPPTHPTNWGSFPPWLQFTPPHPCPQRFGYPPQFDSSSVQAYAPDLQQEQTPSEIQVPPNNSSVKTEVQADNSETHTLFIGNVGFNVTEQMIRDVFASKGFIVSVDLPLDADSGKHAGFGYLHFLSIHSATAAIDAFQGKHIDGHAINLEFSDYTPIEKIVSSANPIINANSSVLRKGSKSSSTEQDQEAPSNCIKSVTFKDPGVDTDEVIPAPPQDTDPKAGKKKMSRVESPPLIDLSTDQISINPELEITRFPPVSQLEAQIFASQTHSQSSASASASDVKAAFAADEEDTFYETSSGPSIPSPPTFKNLPTRSRTFAHPRRNLPTNTPPTSSLGQGHSGGQVDSTLRRANTMMASPSVNNFDTHNPMSSVDRRRLHANERHSRHDPRAPNDAWETWARLNRRERRRSRPHPERAIPGSFPVEETQPVPPISTFESTKESDLMRCVSSLMEMGYGPEHGGPRRMAVYAAAANGNLFDAIEMIEEERKAYAGYGGR
ncbi:hypothetical protein N7495_008533 [Penicillium taxi]|uniref:uncharacterized protein n=1 Tax=Penicillium taxi TaxID=168475 RepID=UPI002544EDB5|nr:uncharacterized protein N7495_008533 [Penicillium taxi]KAJ5888492.1 hypothetical protein N7495_008533 [Penicillium taxi]